jgi:broad specificity phosphatase PhoE
MDNYLFFGHQNRFKGYIVDTFNNLLDDSNKINPKTRFSNGAILCLDVNWRSNSVNVGTQPLTNPNKSAVYWYVNLTLSLIYDGDKLSNKTDKPYWVVVPDNNKNLTKFEEKNIEVTESEFKSIFKINKDIEKKHIRCFFVRHGYSEHNKSLTNRNPFATNTSLIGLNDKTKPVIEDLLRYIDNPSLLNISTPEISIDDFKQLAIYNSLITIIDEDKINEAYIETLHGGASEKVPLNDVGKLLENILNQIYIKKNGEFQSILAGKAFSKILANETIKAVLVSDLVRTQETAGFFTSQLTSSQLPPLTPIIVLPCLHELATGEKDGDQTARKAFSQASRIFTLGATQGIMNRENNTNCRDEKTYFKKDCSKITVNNKIITINWELYKKFYNGYRDENKSGRNHCSKNNFLGIFLDNFVSSDNIKRIDEDNEVFANRIEEGGKRKRRQTKKHRVMKSKKVRRDKKYNKKSKKVKQRSNKRKA